MKNFIFALMLCLTFAFSPGWCEESDVLETGGQAEIRLSLPEGLEDGGLANIRIGNRRIQVEVASTPESRERGLMQRDNLCDDCGMFFVFETADKVNFWMKDTPLPLSIAFIAADGSILNIEEMSPFSMALHASSGAILFALEMNRNWFARNSIMANNKVNILKFLPKAK